MCILAAVTHGSLLYWVLVLSAFIAAGLFISILALRLLKNRRNEPATLDAAWYAGQIDALREMLAGTGYDYDWQQDLFYAVKDPWQKRFGYCRLYDESAAALGMVIDCEPITFDYGRKRWMLELWKGQYGLMTGAEIGLYNTTRPGLDIPELFTGAFYDSAGDDEELQMSYTLFKDKKVLLRRKDVHWWLTGFKLGTFAKPSALKLQAEITFPDRYMRDAFLKGLAVLGYGDKEIRVNGAAVMVLFTKPHSRQPGTRRGVVGKLALVQDRWLVGRYTRLTQNAPNTYKALMLIKTRTPLLYARVMKMGRPRELFGAFDALKDYLN